MTVPARRPVDDALDRLQECERYLWTPNLSTDQMRLNAQSFDESLATVREVLERLREERDEWERIAENRATYAHEQAARMSAHASAPQPTPVSGVPLAATSKASEGAEGSGSGIDTRYRESAEAAEDEVRRLNGYIDQYILDVERLTEGLRKISKRTVNLESFRQLEGEDVQTFAAGMSEAYDDCRAIARALLAASPTDGADDFCEHGYTTEDSAHPSAGLERCPTCSPTDGEPGWFLYHVPSNNVVGEAPTLKEAQAMHAEWVKADERNATEIEVLAFERDGGGAK